MILEPLMLAAIGIEHERDESTNLLVIGLGGGSLDMFFHKQKPKVVVLVYCIRLSRLKLRLMPKLKPKPKAV